MVSSGESRPAPTTHDVKLFVVLPLPDRGYRFLDPANVAMATTIKQIEKNLLVNIVLSEDFLTLTIHAFSQVKAIEALAATHNLLEVKKKDDALAAHPRIFVANEVDDTTGLLYTLKNEDGQTGRRPALASPSTAAGNTTFIAPGSQYRADLETALDLTSELLARTPNKIQMRVHFGKLLLTEWNKSKQQYNLAELEDLLRRTGPRGTAHVEDHIGGEDIVENVRAGLATIASGIKPLKGGTAFDDAQPTFSILVTRDQTLESVIETAQKFGIRDSSDSVAYCFSPFQVFLRGKPEAAVKIMTSRPGKQYDWVLETQRHTRSTICSRFTPEPLRKSTIFADNTLPGTSPGSRYTENL